MRRLPFLVVPAVAACSLITDLDAIAPAPAACESCSDAGADVAVVDATGTDASAKDFVISIQSPTPAIVTLDSSTTTVSVVVAVQRFGSFNGAIDLTFQPIPSGITQPAQTKILSGETTAPVNISKSGGPLAPGDYDVEVAGTDVTATESSKAWLTIHVPGVIGTFTNPDTTTDFTIPLSVRGVRIKAWGGGGGGGTTYTNGALHPGGSGGGAGFVLIDQVVSGGDVLTVVVASGSPAGGGGGGYSAVSKKGVLTPLCLAAGGGGGGDGSFNLDGDNGGAAGGDTGMNGGDGSSTGGTGGSQSAGGTSFSTGGPGMLDLGGNGTMSCPFSPNPGAPGGGKACFTGGGGGAGLYGGGGGGTKQGAGGGGGGGSSLPAGKSTAGNGVSAGGNTDTDYSSGTGNGGAKDTAGGNGRVVILVP
jgi:hypothetical protein